MSASPNVRSDAVTSEAGAGASASRVRAEGAGRPVRNALLLVVGLVAVWQLAYWVVGDVALRSPWQTIRYTFTSLTHTHLFWLHLANTLQAFALALAIAVLLGLLIGFALGLHRLSGEALEPMLVALYSIPKITLFQSASA